MIRKAPNPWMSNQPFGRSDIGGTWQINARCKLEAPKPFEAMSDNYSFSHIKCNSLATNIWFTQFSHIYSFKGRNWESTKACIGWTGTIAGNTITQMAFLRPEFWCLRMHLNVIEWNDDGILDLDISGLFMPNFMGLIGVGEQKVYVLIVFLLSSDHSTMSRLNQPCAQSGCVPSFWKLE